MMSYEVIRLRSHSKNDTPRAWEVVGTFDRLESAVRECWDLRRDQRASGDEFAVRLDGVILEEGDWVQFAELSEA